MLKCSRFFVSTMLVTVLFVSTLILSNPVSSPACPPPPPRTLLSLYLGSDLIFVADIASEKDGKIKNDYEDYYNLEVSRKLKISSVLKGKPLTNFVFTRTEYRDKTSTGTEDVSDNDFEFSPYGYKGYSKLRKGERYLFFFTRDPENGEYELSDFISGAKKLNDYDLSIYIKRLKELQSIQKMEKNQLEALTQWLIRCVEEPSTRWDGVFDLNNSFQILEYADKDDTIQQFRLDDDFTSYSPVIAQNLTYSQKEYLSSILFNILQQNFFEYNEGPYYGLTGLVRRWDKARLAVYSFNMLQTIDNADLKKTNAVMNYISGILDDEVLSDIVERFPITDSPTDTEEKTDEPISTESDQNLALKTENTPQNIEETAETKSEIIETNVPFKTKKLTSVELREKLLHDFINRYQYLVANGFQTPEETKTID